MNVIFGIALVALTIGPVLVHFWPVIEALSGGAAAFLGALVGAAAGLGAILAGALYNAKLNRDENQRLRREEAHALAIAFRAELIVLMSDAKIRLHTLKRLGEADQPVTRADTVLFDIPAKPVCANNTHRLGGLGDRVALSMVGAHGTADHIRHNVAAMLAYPTDVVVGEPGLETNRRDFRSLIKRAVAAVRLSRALVRMKGRSGGRGVKSFERGHGLLAYLRRIRSGPWRPAPLRRRARVARGFRRA